MLHASNNQFKLNSKTHLKHSKIKIKHILPRWVGKG